MEFPVCGNGLTQMTAGEVTVDACADGCGGIWLDRYELMKVDESQESAREGLLEIGRDEGLVVDLSKRRQCPKDDDAVKRRHFFSAKRQVAVDECPSCGGHWLALGELATIRTEFASEEERGQAAQRYFSELFDTELDAAHKETAVLAGAR